MTSVMVGDVEVVIHDRFEWQLDRNPVTGPSFDGDDITTDVGHWPGILGDWQPPTDTASWLRWTQDIYTTGRGYSIGYGFCQGINPPLWIGPRKVVLDAWIVRGLDYRNAANNGDFGRYEHINWNANTISVIALCSPARPLDADMIESMRWLLAAIDVMLGDHRGPRGPRPLQGHRDSDWTSCCGDHMYARLPQIARRPTAPKPAPIPHPEVPPVDKDSRIIHLVGDGKVTWISGHGRKYPILNGSMYKRAQRKIRNLGGNPACKDLHNADEFRLYGPVDFNLWRSGKGPRGQKLMGRKRDAYGVPFKMPKG